MWYIISEDGHKWSEDPGIAFIICKLRFMQKLQLIVFICFQIVYKTYCILYSFSMFTVAE